MLNLPPKLICFQTFCMGLILDATTYEQEQGPHSVLDSNCDRHPSHSVLALASFFLQLIPVEIIVQDYGTL